MLLIVNPNKFYFRKLRLGNMYASSYQIIRLKSGQQE